jgi:hypothetical protein
MSSRIFSVEIENIGFITSLDIDPGFKSNALPTKLFHPLIK